MILNDWACIALVVCTLIVGGTAARIHYQHTEMETAKVAAAAGLVQQVVVTEGHGTYVIWVKPGSPMKVEK